MRWINNAGSRSPVGGSVGEMIWPSCLFVAGGQGKIIWIVLAVAQTNLTYFLSIFLWWKYIKLQKKIKKKKSWKEKQQNGWTLKNLSLCPLSKCFLFADGCLLNVFNQILTHSCISRCQLTPKCCLHGSIYWLGAVTCSRSVSFHSANGPDDWILHWKWGRGG